MLHLGTLRWVFVAIQCFAVASVIAGGPLNAHDSRAPARRAALHIKDITSQDSAATWKRAPKPKAGPFGLNPKNLHHSGIAVGFLPGFGEAIGPNTPQQINAKLSAPMAVIGDYHALDPQDPNLASLDSHITAIQSLAGNPVYSIALMPNSGFASIDQTVANNIAKKMLALNKKGITVWLRFAHEMNGDWYVYGGQPALFLEKWKMIYTAVKSKTTKTYMVWAPNSMFGNSVNDVRGGWTPYWPGAKYVDIVGLSFYHYGGFERMNVLPEPKEAFSMLKSFSKLYGPEGQGKKITLSETGASYRSDADTHEPGPGGASEYDIKTQWLKQLLDPSMAKAIPGLISITWFEIVKDENAGGDSPVRQMDFRVLLGDSKVSKFAQKYLKSG